MKTQNTKILGGQESIETVMDLEKRRLRLSLEDQERMKLRLSQKSLCEETRWSTIH